MGEPLFAYDFAHVLEEDYQLICSKCRRGEYPPKACVHIKAVLCWRRGLALSATWLTYVNTILDSLSREHLKNMLKELETRLVLIEDIESL